MASDTLIFRHPFSTWNGERVRITRRLNGYVQGGYTIEKADDPGQKLLAFGNELFIPSPYCCSHLEDYGTCACPNREQNVGW